MTTTARQHFTVANGKFKWFYLIIVNIRKEEEITKKTTWMPVDDISIQMHSTFRPVVHNFSFSFLSIFWAFPCKNAYFALRVTENENKCGCYTIFTE